MNVDAARCLAGAHVAGLGSRWSHVQAVGRKAEALASSALLGEPVVSSAWLHDIGYAPELATTGFHPLDGAVFLDAERIDPAVVGLVAFHSGAVFEAEERGLLAQLQRFQAPPTELLDVVTLLDMTTGPTGEPVHERDRLGEILRRYEPTDPVHRAVVRSRASIMESCARARLALGLSDEWCGAVV